MPPHLGTAQLNPHLYEKDCVTLVDIILGRISGTLAACDRIEIRGFESFAVREQPIRQGRNPRTEARIVVPAKTVLAFKAGKELRDRLNPEVALR
ncbi:HU family DNA-binding protein [Methylobacterium sp. HMF5984]|uniref:HU family DNA-binding protein n=1 Tax=Methylobacterium sp. HMF5984 TaxID=3367370 RepID=UPI00385194A4